MDERSKWIWLAQGENADQYAEFVDCFDGSSALLRISADSNYAVYVNGKLAAFGQYPDFPHDKVYDEIELSAYCRKAGNRLCIIVWYYGEGSMTYYPGRAALRYEVRQGEKLLSFSDESTLSRQSKAYRNGLCKKDHASAGLQLLL